MWTLEEAAAYYKRMGAPADQTALIGLLREIQQEQGGGIPMYLMREAAAFYGVKESLLLALVKRIPSLRLSGVHTLELCAGPNCGKHQNLAALAEKLAAENPQTIRLKFSPCMRMCGKGPNLRWDGKLYHAADEALLHRLVAEGTKVD
jgi:NADH:ubiquinone oxidoreductase subunit E